MRLLSIPVINFNRCTKTLGPLYDLSPSPDHSGSHWLLTPKYCAVRLQTAHGAPLLCYLIHMPMGPPLLYDLTSMPVGLLLVQARKTISRAEPKCCGKSYLQQCMDIFCSKINVIACYITQWVSLVIPA